MEAADSNYDLSLVEPLLNYLRVLCPIVLAHNDNVDFQELIENCFRSEVSSEALFKFSTAAEHSVLVVESFDHEGKSTNLSSKI